MDFLSIKSIGDVLTRFLIKNYLDVKILDEEVMTCLVAFGLLAVAVLGVFLCRPLRARAQHYLSCLNTDERMIVAAIVLFFISYYLSPVAIWLLLIYALIRRKSLVSPLFVPLGAFCLLAIIEMIVAHNWLGLAASAASYLPGFLAVGFIANAIRPENTRRLLRLFPLLSINAAVVSYLQYIYHLYHPLVNHVTYRPTSVFANANLYAMVLVFIMLLTLGLLLDKREKRHYSWYTLSLALNMAAFFLTGTRMVWPALGVAVLLLLLFMRRYLLTCILGGIYALGLGVLFLCPDLIPRYTVLALNINQRIEIWTCAANAIWQNPWWGGGYLSFRYMVWPAAHEGRIHFMSAHNLLLGAWVEFGIFGVIGLFYAGARAMIAAAMQRKLSDDLTVNAFVFAFLCSLLVTGITDSPIFNLPTGFVFVFALALPFIRRTNQSPGSLVNPRED